MKSVLEEIRIAHPQSGGGLGPLGYSEVWDLIPLHQTKFRIVRKRIRIDFYLIHGSWTSHCLRNFSPPTGGSELRCYLNYSYCAHLVAPFELAGLHQVWSAKAKTERKLGCLDLSSCCSSIKGQWRQKIKAELSPILWATKCRHWLEAVGCVLQRFKKKFEFHLNRDWKQSEMHRLGNFFPLVGEFGMLVPWKTENQKLLIPLLHVGGGGWETGWRLRGGTDYFIMCRFPSFSFQVFFFPLWPSPFKRILWCDHSTLLHLATLLFNRVLSHFLIFLQRKGLCFSPYFSKITLPGISHAWYHCSVKKKRKKNSRTALVSPWNFIGTRGQCLSKAAWSSFT